MNGGAQRGTAGQSLSYQKVTFSPFFIFISCEHINFLAQV